MRALHRIILHCSATIEGAHFDVATIRQWHTSPPRNWSDIGYHYVIWLDGTIEKGRPIEKSGAHTRGHNADSIGVCYIGGVDKDNKPKDTMTPIQDIAFIKLVQSLRMVFGQHLTIHGHNEYAKKACPSFEVADKYNFLITNHE